jgi:hypothetical protein
MPDSETVGMASARIPVELNHDDAGDFIIA